MDSRDSPSWPTTSRSLLAALPDAGNSQAWSEFDRRYGDVVRAFCLDKGLQLADAEDVTQQVFVAVSRRMHEFQYKPEEARFRSWLATVALRAIWKLWGQQRKSQQISLEDVQKLLQPIEQDWLSDYSGPLLNAAAKQIRVEFSAEEWQVFERSSLEDTPYTEIAAELSRSMSWVYQAKSRILKRLKQQIAILYDDIASPLRELP